MYGRPFLSTDIVIDPEVLELTSYVTQLSDFQQALTELQEMTPKPASESSKPLFEPGTEVLIKKLTYSSFPETSFSGNTNTLSKAFPSELI